MTDRGIGADGSREVHACVIAAGGSDSYGDGVIAGSERQVAAKSGGADFHQRIVPPEAVFVAEVGEEQADDGILPVVAEAKPIRSAAVGASGRVVVAVEVGEFADPGARGGGFRPGRADAVTELPIVDEKDGFIQILTIQRENSVLWQGHLRGIFIIRMKEKGEKCKKCDDKDQQFCPVFFLLYHSHILPFSH